MNILGSLNLYANNIRYYYGFDRNSTFVRGFLKQSYKFSRLLSEKELFAIDKKFSFLSFVAMVFSVILIILYLYLIFFNFYLEIQKFPPFLFALTLTFPMFLAVVCPLFLVAQKYEAYLKTYGDYQKEKQTFRLPPNSGKNTVAGFEFHKQRIINESLIGLCVILAFTFFALFFNAIPRVSKDLIKKGNYKLALLLSDVGIKISPVSSINYGHRAVAKYYLKDYSGAASDYEMANKYSQDPVYDADLFVVKSKILTKEQLLNEYDKSINAQVDKYDKYSAIYSKANYLYSVGDYQAALNYYNELVVAYLKGEKIMFSPATLYFKRGSTYSKLGNANASQKDIKIAESMCVDCNYSKNPSVWLDYTLSMDY